jgi:hypothetical protein
MHLEILGSPFSKIKYGTYYPSSPVFLEIQLHRKEEREIVRKDREMRKETKKEGTQETKEEK